MKATSASLTCICLLILAMGSGCPTASAASAAADGMTLIRPEGDYGLLFLHIHTSHEPFYHRGHVAQVRQFYPVRDGTVTIDNGLGITEPGGTLQLTASGLSGRFFWAPKMTEVVIEATVSGRTITGTATMGEERVEVTGHYVPEAELAAANAVDPALGWPTYTGPLMQGLAMTPIDAPLLDDPRRMRPMWRSEELDIGANCGEISRHMKHSIKDALSHRTGSGGAGPVWADGKVFFSYYRASPEPTERAVNKMTFAKSMQRFKNPKRAVKEGGYDADDLPRHAVEKAYQAADEIVLAMDAATGKTLWKAIFPARGNNYQNHKGGPFGMNPAYADGRVFAYHTSGYLTAHDAEQGTLLWQHKVGLFKRFGDVALLALGDRVVMPVGGAWTGFDAATGKQVWRSQIPYSFSTPVPWRHAGVDYGIVGSLRRDGDAVDGRISCLRLADGKEVWSVPVHVLSTGRGNGPGGITVCDDIMLVNRNGGSGEPKAPRIPHLTAYRLAPDAAQQVWDIGPDQARIPDRNPIPRGGDIDVVHMNWSPIHIESNPVVVRKRWVYCADGRVADLQTGKVVFTNPIEDQPRPKNGGYMQAFGDFVMIRVDGTHGHTDCHFYRLDEQGQATLINPESRKHEGRYNRWRPPIGDGSTSYHHPVFYPIVDGRIVFRLRYGLYCYDLRQDGAGSRDR